MPANKADRRAAWLKGELVANIGDRPRLEDLFKSDTIQRNDDGMAKAGGHQDADAIAVSLERRIKADNQGLMIA